MSGMVWPADPSPLPGAPPIKAPADSHVKRSKVKQEQQPPEKITDHAEEGKELRADFVSDAAHITAEAGVVNADQMEPGNDVANAGQLGQEKDVANAGQMQPSSSRAPSTGDCAPDDLDHAGFNATQTDGDGLTETQPKPISVGVGATDWALHGNKMVRFSDAEFQLDAETRKNTALNSGQLLPNHLTTKGNESSQENARANLTQTLPNENLSRVDEIPLRDTRANANPPSTPSKQSLAAIQGTLPWNFTARERIGEIFCSAVRYLTLAWQWACQRFRAARDQLRAHCPWMFNNYAYSVFCSAIIWSLANPNFLLLIASVA